LQPTSGDVDSEYRKRAGIAPVTAQAEIIAVSNLTPALSF